MVGPAFLFYCGLRLSELSSTCQSLRRGACLRFLNRSHNIYMKSYACSSSLCFPAGLTMGCAAQSQLLVKTFFKYANNQRGPQTKVFVRMHFCLTA